MQCNIISLTGILQYIITFVTVGCRQMKVLKKLHAIFGVSNSHGIQKAGTASERSSTKVTV